MGNLGMLCALTVGLVKSGVSIEVTESSDGFHQFAGGFFVFIAEAIYQTIHLPQLAATWICSTNK
jgi:hypothetical protein